jgi:hypothetical protein
MPDRRRPDSISPALAEYIFKISLDSIYMEHRGKGISLGRFCRLVKRQCARLLDEPGPGGPVQLS